MASSKNESFLPKVKESDLLDLVFEDVTDPTHRVRWQQVAESNPALAREVLRRAFFNTQTHDSHLHPGELQKIIIDEISFVIQALERAARRTREDETTTVGDGVDEGQPLST